MMKKSVKEMTTDECRAFLGRGSWKRSVGLMYQALTKARACDKESEKRVYLLEAAAWADHVISTLHFMSGYKGEQNVKITESVSAPLWAIEEDAINALKKRYELNGIDYFYDNGYRMFRTLQQPVQASDPYETF